MDINQIREILESPYDRKIWKSFIQNQFTNINLLANDKPFDLGKSDLYTNCHLLGNYAVDEYTKIGIFEIQLADKVNLNRNRVALRSLIKDITKQVAGVMVVFVQGDKWRFSYISKGKIRNATTNTVEDVETEPKRYTYLFGEGENARTAAERFAKLPKNATLKEIEDAFSVEKLSTEFFEKYKKQYGIFCKFMIDATSIRQTIFNGDEKGIRDFNKKLLGRIVFLYFIQKKGWLGVSVADDWGKGNFDFLTQQFENFKNKDLFYQQFLSPLFFETLNQKRENDVALFLNDQASDILKIPYLNGGLFEEDDKKHRNLIFPENLFKSLFEFFNQYNFTIYEDDPNDQTVAVDPEMLGHIFENLLEDNKDKGAYYTPKGIVHYMCQESLIEYLCTCLTIEPEDKEKEAITIFLKKKEIDIILKPEIKNINDALDNVKICDPAIGSGAFPMGLLHEIFTAKQTLHNFEHGNTKTFDASGTKLNIIQNSIYGVDIEKGAVDIARLRFWLSLIVDEETPKALPNLDYKIVVGNSLVSKLGNDIIDIDWTLNETSHGFFGADLAIQKGELLKKIGKEQKEFFNPNSDKKKLAANIRNLKIDLLINQLELMVKTKGLETKPTGTAKAITKQTEIYLQTIGWKNSINDLQKLKNKPELPLHFFDWKLDFPEVMNPLVFENNHSKIVVANAQILALNTQIDAINLHLQAHSIDTHLIHLQANVAQGQVEIVKEQLGQLEKTIKDIFGKIITVDQNIMSEPDLSFAYNINSINKGIEEINQRIDAINPQIEKQNPNVGFDIVIANPPYIDSETMVNTGNEYLRIFLSKKLLFCKGNWDIYIAFFDFSYSLLNSTGNLVFITPDKWISKPFGDEIRKGLKENFVSIAEAGRKVFENAKVDSIITFIAKTPKSHIKIDKFVNGEAINFSSIDKTSLVEPYAFDWLFSDFISKINQMDKFPNKLSDYAVCENACATSDAYKIKDYLFNTSFDAGKHLKIINTGTIGRYVSKWGKREMTYLKDKYLEPVVDKKKFQKDFSNSYGSKSILPKLIIKGLTLLDGCIDTEGIIIPGKSTLVITKPQGKENELLFPLALINSKISLFYIKEKYRGSSYNQGINFNPDMLNNLPIPSIGKSTMQLIISSVQKIINKNEKEYDTLSLEQDLNNIFYKLYELTFDEVKVIDPAFSLSKKEYETIKLE